MQTMSLVRDKTYSPRRAGERTMAKIYLVDDDENILTSVSMFLEAEGYEVRKFHDGVTALEALKKSPPDLAVFDVKMPRMDGLELLRRLRQTSNLPVIFLTSKDDEFDEAIGFNMGADDYINQLMDAAYDDQVYVDDRTIDSHIKRLRKKFRKTDKSFDGIETLYGVGYKYKEA